MINNKRVRELKKGFAGSGPVIYWMSREQRVRDNWSLVHAIELAENENRHVLTVFVMVNGPGADTWRHTDFLLKGLEKVEKDLRALNIPFLMLQGEPAETLQKFLSEHQAGRLVTDFDPLRESRQRKDQVLEHVSIPVDEVDAHNIVPCWLASARDEYAAYTLRPKIKKLLPEFLDEFPPLVRQRQHLQLFRNNWEAIAGASASDHTVPSVQWVSPGEDAARTVMERFFEHSLEDYAGTRNDPNGDGTSNLSAYIRFGHISAQRIALEVLRRFPQSGGTDAFLEELIIRRELADNFCHGNPHYDDIKGFRAWARQTLDKHAGDPRPFLYSRDQFEKAVTHDALWNAAQWQMVSTGKMHGYMRMYWAKKILEWSPGPAEALATALYLNDKYELDGHCPNGYAGCAWSIGGTHDRPWFERQVFGKIRYMNRSGCERKFNVSRYIARFSVVRDKSGTM